MASLMPSIPAYSVWLTEFVVPHIGITINEFLLPSAMLQKILILALVSAVLMLENPLSVLPIVHPFALVAVAFRGPPDSESALYAIFPVPLEFLPIVPFKCSISLPFPINKVPFVYSVYVAFAALYFDVVVINSLKNFLLSDVDASAIFRLVVVLPKVHALLLFHNGE